MSPPLPPAAPPSISYRAEVGRKVLHLLALVLPLGAWYLGPPAAQVALGVLATIALGSDVLRARSVAFDGFIDRFFGWMMRREEQAVVPGPVVFNGATWVTVSIFVLTLLFPIPLAARAFAAFMVADAAAALVGRRFGRRRWPGTTRTFEGSAAFFVVAVAVLLLLRIPPGPALACAAVSALGEAVPGPLNDNLLVPLLGTLVLVLFNL